MELKVTLDKQDWNERTPTHTQIINLLDNLSKFVNNLGGLLMATGEYHIAEQDGPPQANPIAALLNAAGSLKNAKDVFAGMSGSGLVVPQAGRGPQPMQR